MADEILQTLRKGRRQDIETIGGAGLVPDFHVVGDLLGRDREMR